MSLAFGIPLVIFIIGLIWLGGVVIIVASDVLIQKYRPDSRGLTLGVLHAYPWLVWQILKALGRSLWDHLAAYVATFEATLVVAHMNSWIHHQQQWWEVLFALYFVGLTFWMIKVEVEQWHLRVMRLKNLKSGRPSPSSSLLPVGSLQSRAHFQQALLASRLPQSPSLPVAKVLGHGASMPRKLADPVLGFRVWNFFHDDPANLRLAPLNHGWGDWQPGVNVAICQRNLHEAPQHLCHCGFWIKDSLQGAIHVGGNIAGVAQGWGKVFRHEDGYRLQHASVVALAVPFFKGDAPLPTAYMKAAEALALRFDVPLHHNVHELIQYVPNALPQMALLMCDHCHYQHELPLDQLEYAGAHWIGKGCMRPLAVDELPSGLVALKNLPCEGTMHVIAYS